MCSRWDRWGSRPLFEDPAEEVSAGRGFLTPLRKIFRTQSHWATSPPSVSLRTMLRFDTAGLLLSRHTLQKITFTNSPLCSDSEKQPEDYLAVQTRIREIWFMRESKRKWEERDGGKKPSTSYSVFKSILEPTIWILWCPLHCGWQIITNWIPHLSWHAVNPDMSLL